MIALSQPRQVDAEPVLGHDDLARHNREHLRAAGVVAINLMGARCSGMAAVLEATAGRLDGGIMVIAADLAPGRDTVQRRKAGITSVTVKTGADGHVDAGLVHEVLHAVPSGTIRYLFIENSNRPCPGRFDLGQAANVVVISVPRADLVLVTRTDLLRPAHRRLDADAGLLPVCARTGAGMPEWTEWLASLARRARRAAADPAGLPAQRFT